MSFQKLGARLRPLVLFSLIFSSLFSTTLAKVTLTVNGKAASLANGVLTINFNADSKVASLYVSGKNIVTNLGGARSFYLDWNAGGEGVLDPSKLVVVENTDARAHLYYIQDSLSGAFNIELHYVLEDGARTLYSYAKYSNKQNSDVGAGETRTVYRFDPSVLTQETNSVRDGTLPVATDFAGATQVQDATWQFTNGTYYTKYDFAFYIRDVPYQGVFGNGYGAFVISPSREYHGGGPLKQDITVHDASLVANYLSSSHFGTPGITAPPGWSKFFGPWAIFFPTGSNEQIIEAVKQQTITEKNRWPYNFVNDPEYPLERGSVTGQVTGQPKAQVVLYDSLTEVFDMQGQGYLYSTQTDSSGRFSFEKVRPGNYRLLAYPLAGQGSENLAQKDISVQTGSQDAGTLDLPEPTGIIWSIGETNRKSSEYKYSNEPRNFKWKSYPPATLNFTIGQSNIAEDWYYSQSNPGIWNVIWDDTNDGRSRTLRIAVAGAAAGVHLIPSVNGHRVGDLYFDNDSSVYRSAMQSGRFTSNVLTVNPLYILNGRNVLSLLTSRGQILYDAISLARD